MRYLIRLQLRDQRFHRVEFLHGPHVVDESEFDLGAVEVDLLIEQVRLDLMLRDAIERRVVADRHGRAISDRHPPSPRPRRPRPPAASPRSRDRDWPSGSRGRARAPRRGPRETGWWAAGRAARPPRGRGRPSSSSRIQVDERRRSTPPSSWCTSSISSTAKPYCAPNRRSDSRSPVPFSPNRKSAPASTSLVCSGVDEYLPDELFRRQGGELRGERQHHGDGDPHLGEQLGLLGGADERRGNAIRADDAERVAIEGDDRGHQPRGIRPLAQLGEDAAMPEMDAVELADRDRRRSEIGRNGGETVVELHRRTSATTRLRRSQSRPSTGSTSGTSRYPAPYALQTVAWRPKGSSESRPSRAGATTLRVPITSTPASSKQIVSRATRRQPSASATVATM